ncbi:hypothetical protein DGMP_06660 [Desulfomarina profundi]|uniref:Uncharacterized protein n=1 Tax=Desulfomarina profundi TaxID=2772557 RepID=A0A8D5JCR6_9BACT|nr:hypothetical protein [Desulfomarina profundi]BCL59973.1 hypothetical protein DGMP_06660 [Desulfomarina profundi]
MAITKTDIKLMASERLDDSVDGGGRMTGTEIVDGNVNNLFPDISRLDRVMGRVSLRKGFVAVLTENQDTYYGVNVIITDPAEDPLVSVCMFTTDNPFDKRVGARDRIESYVVQGTRFAGYLWGRHIAGARAIALIMEPKEELPGVGDVLYLVEGDNSQYVRITDVSSNSTAFDSTVKNVVTCGISDPLRFDFYGYEVADANKSDKSLVYTTLVADAAAYFGVMRPTAQMNKGDLVVNVDSIYTHLVPSAQSESPIVDVTAGTVPASFASGDGTDFQYSSALYQQPGISNYLPVPAVPGTLTFGGQGHYFHTVGDKVIYDNNGQEVGTIDHASGRIDYYPNIAPVLTGNTGSLTFQPAAGGLRIGNSKALPVLLSNRGYNYVTSLVPLPDPGSVVVDYMAQGKWYRLKDDGNGVLRGISGSGSVDYGTGSLIITCGALPDADTAIMINWGNPIEYINRGGKTLTNRFVLNHTVAEGSINPGSLQIKWWQGGQELTATDDGSGAITGSDAGGTVIYARGEIRFTPAVTPDDGSQISFEYEQFAKVIHSQGVSSGNNSFTLPSFPVKPGTLHMQMDYSGHGYTRTVDLHDDGAGHIICDPPLITVGKPLGHDSWEGSTKITVLETAGTIDYNTGQIFFYGTASGLVKWIEKQMKTETVEV